MMSGMHTHRPGRIVLLNGTSSSGKTSISACLYATPQAWRTGMPASGKSGNFGSK